MPRPRHEHERSAPRTNPVPAHASRGFALPLIVLAGLVGIFLVPWFVPQAGPVASASYTLGFNNLAATLAFGVLLAAIFLHLLRRPRPASGLTEKILSEMLSSRGSGAGARGSLIVFGVAVVISTAALITFYRVLPHSAYSEFENDITRLDLMVLGLRPYRDFQYNYGPGMLYPAYWIYRLAAGRLSIDGAFAATVALHWMAGLSLLHYTVRRLCSGRAAALVFACAALAVFNLSLGVGYTPLRFLPPIAALLFLHGRFGHWADDGVRGLLGSSAAVVLLSLGSLSLSPEIGIASTAGLAAFFASLFFTPLRRMSVVALAPVFSLGIALLLFSPDYLGGLVSHGSGANNFPVFPTPAILLLLVASCVVLPRLGVIGVRSRDQQGALALGLVVSLGLLLRAAFGRCDPGHVLLNALGIHLLFLAVAVRCPGRIAALALGAFVLVHPVTAQLSFAKAGSPFRTALETSKTLAGLDTQRNEAAWRWATGASGSLRYGKLMPFTGLLRQRS